MESEHIFISVVVPCYRCDTSLEELSQRLDATMTSSSTYELLLVDDRSPADDWRVIQAISNGNPDIKGIRLSRNFGQHYAISVSGLDYARGDWCVVVMDGDLQPEEIPKLWEKADEEDTM